MPSLEKRVRAAYEVARETLGVRDSVRRVAQSLSMSEDAICHTIGLELPENRFHVRSKRTGAVHSRHVSGDMGLQPPGTEGWEPVRLTRQQAQAAKSILERKWQFSMEIVPCQKLSSSK